LVGREIITRVSPQSRGTAVRYGPGPGFPTRSRAKRNIRKNEDRKDPGAEE
jgi:ATP-dependent DNA helicase RecG